MGDFRTRLVVLEKNRTVDNVFRGLIGLGALLFVVAIAAHIPLFVLGLHLSVISALLRWGVVRQNAYAKPVERAVEASRSGVTADGALLERARIADGWYQPRAPVKSWLKKRPATSTVQLVDKRKRILFESEVESEEQAVQMLNALGLSASQKRAEFRGASDIGATQGRMFAFGVSIAIAIAAMMAFSTGHHVNPSFPMVLLAVPFSLLSAFPSKITVGVDGILMRWLWRKRFVPMSRVVSATADGSTRIRLELTDGSFQTIYTANNKRSGGVYTQHRDLVLARIREAMRAYREMGPGADVATLVARGERTPAEWKKALSALGENDASYRQAAIREEDLWRVVEDPRAAADARAGAAHLLRKGLDADGKARVRVAAEATASPKLRVALEAVAANAGSDEAVEEALDALAAEKHA